MDSQHRVKAKFSKNFVNFSYIHLLNNGKNVREGEECMKYFMVTVKCGHVGKNNYYKGTLFLKAENGRAAAKQARECPRVKHDQKDAILSVSEIDEMIFEIGRELNHTIHYYTCESIQEQRMYFSEIENNVFVEQRVYEEPKKYAKKHSLRKIYNMDPNYEFLKKNRYLDYYIA